MSLAIFRNAPVATRVHFKNEAARRKFAAGEMTTMQAKQSMNNVEVLQGMDMKTLKQLRSNMKYAAKINDPAWKAEAARRKGETT